MIPVIIFFFSSAIHFIFSGNPPSVVFDEVYYGNFASEYWHGTYFFDLHPPFAKMVFASIGYLFGLNNYSADWSNIGNPIPLEMLDLRVITAFAGTILPLVIYIICRKLKFSKIAAILASAFICLENSLVVQSRYILPDVIMIICGFTAILVYQIYLKKINKSKSYLLLSLAIVLATLAFSVKWTGLTFIFIIFVSEVYRLYKIKEVFGLILKFGLIFSSIYISIFAIHFSALPYSGKGDPFMTPEFQKNLIGNEFSNDENINKKGFIGKFIELNHTMLTSSTGMTATHSYSSKWYTWPIMKRGIFYWESKGVTADGLKAYIYLIGNPFIYWIGTLSVILSTILLLLLAVSSSLRRYFLNHSEYKNKIPILFILTAGYMVNFLPFIFIGRIMFLYHYEIALIFSIALTAFLLDFLKKKYKIIFFIILIATSFSAFIYWSPLTYGLPITDKQLQSRMWLNTWR